MMISRVYLILASFLFLTCESKPERIEVYSILHDITDPLLAQPDAESFLNLIDVSDNQKTIVCRYRIISDVDFNPVTQLKRPAQSSGLFSNALEQKKKHRDFESQCGILLAEKTPIQGEAHSSIFEPIVNELTFLGSLPKTYDKHLIIYSDLRENCQWLSFYRYQDLWLLNNKPDKIIQRFMDVAELLNAIENISVNVVFIPENHRGNAEFKKIQKIYLKVFKRLGIPIKFSASISNAELNR